GRNEEGAIHVWRAPEIVEGIAIVVGFARLVLPSRRDPIVSERTIRRQFERPFGTAPISNLHGSLVDFLVLAVARRDFHDGASRQQLHACWGVSAKNCLQMNFFTKPVYAAIREHRSA